MKGSVYQAEAPVDPIKELSRLVAEQKFEEAFTGALHRSDVSIVSWLCSQVCPILLVGADARRCFSFEPIWTLQISFKQKTIIVSSHLVVNSVIGF